MNLHFFVVGALLVGIANATMISPLWNFNVLKNAGLTFVGIAEYTFFGPSNSDELHEYLCDIHDSFGFLYDYTNT